MGRELLQKTYFQGKHYYEFLGMDPNAREQYRGEPWFELCEQFADDWDQAAFDPDGETYPLEHFVPMINRVFTHGMLAD